MVRRMPATGILVSAVIFLGCSGESGQPPERKADIVVLETQ